MYYIISYLLAIILERTHSDKIQSHHHKRRHKNNTVNKVIYIELHTVTNCTTLNHTYCLLYFKGHIQITYNHTHHKGRNKNNTVNKVVNIELHTITNCTILYHTYWLLYYKGHIQITYNHTTIKVETKTIE